jgi:hypothetical protein
MGSKFLASKNTKSSNVSIWYINNQLKNKSIYLPSSNKKDMKDLTLSSVRVN